MLDAFLDVQDDLLKVVPSGGPHAVEIQMDDFYGADEMRFIEKDRRSLAEKTLDNTRTTSRNTAISYELSFTVTYDEIDALINDNDHHRITTKEDVARHLARIHHEQEYSDDAGVTVGLVSAEEQSDDVSFRLIINAAE